MKKIITQIILIGIILCVLFPKPSSCQTIYLDNIKISIGDSLEYVTKKFSEPPYHINIDTLKNYLRCFIYKETTQEYDEVKKPVRILGYLYFEYYPTNIHIRYTKELYKIDKVWNTENTNDVNSLLEVINNIIEKNEIDKYSTELLVSKKIEPDILTNTISININSFTSLQIYYRTDKYYEISEVITKDETKFTDKEYILIFEDSAHLIGKQNLIIEKFGKEYDAEYRSRELTLPYLIKGLEMPNNKIVRFNKKLFK